MSLSAQVHDDRSLCKNSDRHVLKVLGEVSNLTTSFSALSVASPAKDAAPALQGLALLHQRGVIDASGRIINRALEYDCQLPQDAVVRVFALLHAPRSINGCPLNLMQLFCSWHVYLSNLDPTFRLVGDDLYRLVGYEKLKNDLLKLYSAENGHIESFVPNDVLEDLKNRCSLLLNAITLRIYVRDMREIHNIATLLQYGLLSIYGQGASSPVKQEEDHSRFSFTTALNGKNLAVHIVVTTAASYATTAGMMQIDITPGRKQFLYEFKQGYQWALDVTYKLLRPNSNGKNLTGTLIRHLREQQFPMEGCFEILKKELLAEGNQKDALLALWFQLNDISSMQNVFLIADLVYRGGQRVLATSFFEVAALQVPVSDGFWYASSRLVLEENISYGDLRVLLQVFGAIFARVEAKGACHVERKSDLLEKLVFSINGEFSLILSPDLSAAQERIYVLLSMLAGKQTFQKWLGYFIPRHQARHNGAAFSQITSSVSEQVGALPPSGIEGYFSHILLGNHEMLLRHFVPVVGQSEGSLKQFFAFIMKCVLMSQNHPVPEVNSEKLEVEWIDYLLKVSNPSFRQIGLDLLCMLKGQVEIKKKWILHYLTIEPASARRLIRTVESEVAESVVKDWLEKASQPEILALDLLQSGRWDLLVAKVQPDSCLTVCHNIIEKNAARAERILDSIIQNFSHADQRVLPLLLRVTNITENMAKWYFAGIKEKHLVATNDQAFFCRKLSRAHPELFSIDHVAYIVKVHGGSVEALLDSTDKEVQEMGVALASRSQDFAPRTLKKLWHNLRQMLPDNFDPWSGAFIHCVKAIGEAFPPDKTELLPVLLHPEALQHVPKVVTRLLQEIQKTEFTHANRSHVRRLVSECMTRGLPCSVLITLVDLQVQFCTEPVQDAVKSELLQKLEKDSSQAAVVWYLAKVRAKFFAPRHFPVCQVRLLLRAFSVCRSELAGEFCEYVRNLANVKDAGEAKADVEQAKPRDADEFLKIFGPFVLVKVKPAAKPAPTSLDKIKSCIRFNKWSEAASLLLEHAGEKEDAELVCREQATQPTSQLFKLLRKYEIADLAIWKAILHACEPVTAGEAIIVLLGLKASLDTGVQLALWQEIIKKPDWLCQESAFAVFKELNYVRLVLRDAPNQEEVTRAIGTFIEEFIIALKDSNKRKEYLECAHQNLEVLARDPADYFRLGLTLLSYSELYADTADFIRDCKLFERLLGHLQTVITSVYEFVTRNVSQQKSATQPRGVRLERFYSTCRAFFKMAHARIAERDAIAAFSSLITKMSEISFIDPLLLETLALFPDLEVRQALVHPLKRKLADCLFRTEDQAPTKETLQSIRQLLTNLLEQGSAQTLKHIYHCCSNQKRINNSQHPELLQLLERSSTKYFGFILESSDVFDCSIALDVALVLRQSVPNRADTVFELILRIIKRSGWDIELRNQVEEFCQQSFTQTADEGYICTMSNVLGERFYQSACPSMDKHIGTLVPFICKREAMPRASEQQFLQLSNQFISMSIKKAVVCNDASAKARLLDVAAEAIRVNLERYPHDMLLPTQLMNLSMACSQNDTLLYPAHCKIAFTLIKRAFQRGIVNQAQPGLEMWLMHLGKSVQDLSAPSDLSGLFELQQSIFLLGTRDGFSEPLLIASQQRLLSIQEALSEVDLEKRESILRDLLRVWKEHPAVLFNSNVKESMEMLLCPNSHFFGCDMGAKGKQHAKRCASMYLDTLSAMFSKQTSQLSKQSCARQIIESTIEAKRYHAFDGDEETFVNQAKRLLDLLGECHTVDLIELCAKCFLMPTLEAGAHVKMRLLKQELLPYIQKHDPKMKNGILNAIRQEFSR